MRSAWRSLYASGCQTLQSYGGGWLGHKNWMVFFDYKVAKEMCAQPIPPFWGRWRAWLYEHRRPHHHDDALVLPRGTDTLRKLQQEMFKGTECSLTGWHPWKRMGATCFRALGGSLQALTIWARWRTPRQAARYAAHPPAWKMPNRVLLPRPMGNTGHFMRDCEWQWMPVRDLWHADAFAWDAGRKRAKQPPTVQSFARPITPEEVDSESDDDDDMEDDEERPEDGAAEGHKTSEDQGERTYRGSKGDVVATEPGMELGPMVAAGAGVERKGDIDGGAGDMPTGSGEWPAAAEEQVQSRRADDPADGGQDACGAEHYAKPTAVFVRERSCGEDRQTTTEENYVTVLQAMRNDEMEPWDVSPTGDISPTRDQDGNPDRGRLTVETASNGLGLASKVHVPREMWDRLRPCNCAEAHEGTAEQKASTDIKLAAMIQRVHTDGLIDRV